MYLVIDSVDFTTTLEQGYPTHRIQDVWAYADGLSIGVFELPAVIPVLSADAEVQIDIFGGIRNNGSTFAPLQYPFFERNAYTLDFEPGTFVELSPSFTYREGVTIAVNEDFEGPAIFTVDCDEDDTSILASTSDPENVIYGNRAGSITVNSQNLLFQQATFEVFDVEDFGSSEVFVELDFKSDIEFTFGYIGFDGVTPIKRFPNGFNPTDEWTKIYLDLSVDLNGGEFDAYQLMIAGAPVNEGGTIWIDNIKLVYNER